MADTNTLVLKQYERLKLHEQQFNAQLTETKKFSSGWLLAAFGAIAYLVKDTAPTPLLERHLLIAIVALLGNIGLFTLWILDHKVYQVLLNSIIYLALKMEKKHPDVLPPIRLTILKKCGNLGFYIAIFYILPMSALAAISLYFNVLIGILSFIIVLGVSALSRENPFREFKTQ